MRAGLGLRLVQGSAVRQGGKIVGRASRLDTLRRQCPQRHAATSHWDSLSYRSGWSDSALGGDRGASGRPGGVPGRVGVALDGSRRGRPAPGSRPAARRNSADAFEPMALFTKHHASEPGTSEATAMLLLTDQRWRGGAGQLVRLIANSGLLTDEQLDGLAIEFLAADRYVYWPVPDAWFTAESVALVVSDDAGEDADEAAVSEAPALAARDVAPPLVVGPRLVSLPGSPGPGRGCWQRPGTSTLGMALRW